MLGEDDDEDQPADQPTGSADANIDADAFTNANFISHDNNAETSGVFGVEYVSHMGTYDGAKGVYECRAAEDAVGGCTSRINDDGSIVLAGVSSIWTFTPAAGAKVMVEDSVYLHFGWWLRENKAPVQYTGDLDVETVYGTVGGKVYAPADADGTVNDGSFLAVTGIATFAGKAAGKYALVDSLNDTAEGGHWTADASLTAKFGNQACLHRCR